MKCCKEGCDRNVPCEFEIRVGREVLLRVPLFCLVEKLQALMDDDEVDMETYFAGLEWYGSGVLDLERFKEEASEILAIRISEIFGGNIAAYFSPLPQGDRRVGSYGGLWRKPFGEHPKEAMAEAN